MAPCSVPYTVDVPMERPSRSRTGRFMGITFLVSSVILIESYQRDSRPPGFDPEIMKMIERGADEEEIERFLQREQTPLAALESEEILTCATHHLRVRARRCPSSGRQSPLLVRVRQRGQCQARAPPVSRLYFLLGAVAGLAWMGMGNGTPLVGASGAIMGIVGLFLAFSRATTSACSTGLGWPLADRSRSPRYS